MGEVAKLKPREVVITDKTISLVIADAGKKLATTTDVRELKDLADSLEEFRKIVAGVTKDREKINKVGDPLIETQVKCGRELTRMEQAGERQGRGGDQKSNSHGDSLITLEELGFTWSRASRWQIAGKLPDNLRADYKTKMLATSDGILALAGVVKAGKLWLGKQQQAEGVEPTEATIVNSDWKTWLPDQSQCDLLLTDPPYSTDIADIAAFAKEWLPVALSKVKPTGRAYVCIGAYPEELHAYLSVPAPKHLDLRQVLVWTYRNRVGPSPDEEYKLNWQAILYYVGESAPPLNCSRAVSEYPKLNEQFTVQDINLPDARRFESWHKWQKPDELCERFVHHASQPGELILDPFAGTGSFLLAAARLGRIARGCDVSEDMVAIAKKRGCK